MVKNTSSCGDRGHAEHDEKKTRRHRQKSDDTWHAEKYEKHDDIGHAAKRKGSRLFRYCVGCQKLTPNSVDCFRLFWRLFMLLGNYFGRQTMETNLGCGFEIVVDDRLFGQQQKTFQCGRKTSRGPSRFSRRHGLP